MSDLQYLKDNLCVEKQTVEWQSVCGNIRFKKQGKTWAWIPDPVQKGMVNPNFIDLQFEGFSSRKAAADYAQMAFGSFYALDCSNFVLKSQKTYRIKNTPILVMGSACNWKVLLSLGKQFSKNQHYKKLFKDMFQWQISSGITKARFETKNLALENFYQKAAQDNINWFWA